MDPRRLLSSGLNPSWINSGNYVTGSPEDRGVTAALALQSVDELRRVVKKPTKRIVKSPQIEFGRQRERASRQFKQSFKVCIICTKHTCKQNKSRQSVHNMNM